MNNNHLNMDGFIKEIINKAGEEQPGKDFTKNVMSQILKDPLIEVSFITKDDKRINIWLIISIAIMLAGSFIFYFIKSGYSFQNMGENIQTPSIFTFFSNFFAKFWNELSLSPYILIALIGVIVLVVIDRTIVRYLYSI